MNFIFKNKISLGLIAIQLGVASLFGQNGRLEKANMLYENLSYAEAAPIYERILKKDTSNNTVLRKLANSYYKMNMPEQALPHYEKISKLSGVKKNEIDNYVWALESLKKYSKAEKVRSAFDKTNLNPNRLSKLEKLKVNNGVFSVGKVNLNSVLSDFSPTYYMDDKIIYVSSTDYKDKVISRKHTWNKEPFYNLFTAKITEDGELSNKKKFSNALNTRYHEGPLTITNDQKMIYFTRNDFQDGERGYDKNGITRLKIYSVMVDENGKWSDEKSFIHNNSEYSVGHPTLSKDGRYMYFASDMPGGFGGTDLYVSELIDGNWTTPVNLGSKINTEANEAFPFIHPNGNLFFASDGHIGLGGLDLYAAKRTGDKFSTVQNLGGSINSSFDDFGLILSKNEKDGYFSSNRSNGKGLDDIYSFDVLKPIFNIFILKGVVSDATTKNTLPEVDVFLLSESGDTLFNQTTKQDGSYFFEVSPDESYTLNSIKEGYNPISVSIDKDNLNIEDGEYIKDVLVNKEAIILLGTIKSKDYQVPIKDAKIEIVDLDSKEVLYTFSTAIDGKFSKKLKNIKKGDKLKYIVKVSAPGYLSISEKFKKTISTEKQIDLTKELDIALSKIEVGSDIGKIINIKPIYFDLNKADIRPDAAEELDKIVKVMQENPEMIIELGSHTDSRGSDAYNEKLSDKRAKSSAAYVKRFLKDPSRIYGKGYGEKQLVNKCSNGVKCSEDEHQTNRRTEFKVIKM